MKTIKKIVSSTLGVSVLFINALPVFSKASTDQTLISTSMDTGLKSVDTTASIITDSLDSLTIEKTKQVPVYETQPEYIPVYSYAEPYVEVPEESTTMTVEEFMALYGQTEEAIPVDTSIEEDAYQLALANYNSALAEYEAASQMIETTKDVEVAIIEEVTDDEGNVSEVTRTEVQTVTEMVPAGDVETAKVNLDAAKAALDAAQMALDSAKNTIVQADTEIVEPEATKDEDIQSIIESDSNENEQTVIDEDVVVKEDQTYVYSGYCGSSLYWALDDKNVLRISGVGNLNEHIMNDYTSDSPAPWHGVGKVVESVIIYDEVINIGDYAFSNCESLKSISIPASVTHIGAHAFSNCTLLSSITIPDSVISIGSFAFYNCNKLTNITIPNNVTSINNYTFYKCSALSSISIPDGVTHIKLCAFSSCSNLSSIMIPESVISIDSNAFTICNNLKSIYYKGSIEEWEEKKLYKFINVTLYFACGDNLTWTRDDNGLLTISGTGLMYDYVNAGPWGKSIKSVLISSGVTSIGNYAFSGCVDLTSITIPDSVINIGKGAFEECTNLKTAGPIGSGCDCEFGWIDQIPKNAFSGFTSLINIIIPNGITSIGEHAFNGCTGLIRIIIPDSVTSIGNYAFSGCVDLKSITIPDSVINIGKGAFEECTNLKTAGPIGSGCDCEFGWIDQIPKNAFFGCTSLISVKIPVGITTINVQAFYKCTALSNVIIPDTVVSIDNNAFRECTSLSTITIPTSLISIGVRTFSKCGFTSITIPESVTTIGEHAFNGCSYLTSIEIPNSVTKLGESMCNECPNLTDIYYHGTEEDWNKIELCTDRWIRSIPESVVIHYIDDSFPFKDVYTDAWYYSVAKECYETGLINGTSPTTFSPMQEMTRAMVVTILWRMEGQPKVDFNNKFSDVSAKQWYATSVSWAEQAGVVHGYGDGTFKPDAAVTREQVAVMLANYAQYKGVYVPGTKKLNEYPDGSQVSAWAQAGMKWAITNGIISGNGAGYLNPKKSATRAEGAAMLLRMKNWL